MFIYKYVLHTKIILPLILICITDIYAMYMYMTVSNICTLRLLPLMSDYKLNETVAQWSMLFYTFH